MHYHVFYVETPPCHYNYSAIDNICVLCPFTLGDNIMLDALTLLGHEF